MKKTPDSKAQRGKVAKAVTKAPAKSADRNGKPQASASASTATPQAANTHWFFPRHDFGQDDGLNDPGVETFKKLS